MADRLPGVQGKGSGPLCQGPGLVLAVRAVAPLRLGELAAAAFPKLRPVQSPEVLVPLAEEYCLRRVWGANNLPLTRPSGAQGLDLK